jgi:hypothetical protein
MGVENREMEWRILKRVMKKKCRIEERIIR